MEIPQALRQVFDTFPLKTYPSIAASTPGQLGALEARKFYFTPTSSESATSSGTNVSEKPSTITLGVHNVVQYKNVILPSDPISLAQCLIICHKNNLNLPSADTKALEGDASPNCLMTLSHHAAADNQLPILIEDTIKVQGTEPVRSIFASFSIINSNKKDLKNSTDVLINNMLDTVLVDVWLTCLLADPRVSPEILSKIFTLDSSTLTPLSLKGLYTTSLLQDIPKWSSYQFRHPNVFHDSKLNDTIALVANGRNGALQSFYSQQLTELPEQLELILNYVEAADSVVFKMKLTGFLLLVDLTLPDTELGQVVKRCSYLEKAYSNI